MTAESFAAYLSALDSASLGTLLQARPDVLLEPVPRSFEQLAQRLEGHDSLVFATLALNRDAVRVGQSAAALAGAATVPGLVGLLGAPEDAVQAHVDDLCARGLAWVGSDAVVRLPQRLHDHWSAEIGNARPVEKIARSVLADDLRAALTALGASTGGLRKPELVARLAELMSDPRRLAPVIAALPAKEVPPPLPLGSAAGRIRQALLRTVATGESVRLAGENIGWFCPMHGYNLLARLNARLDDAELTLLADAVENHRDVVIAYRDNNGTRTVRRIQPNQLYGKWLDSWCHLRDAQRDFSVANIESVGPAG